MGGSQRQLVSETPNCDMNIELTGASWDGPEVVVILANVGGGVVDCRAQVKYIDSKMVSTVVLSQNTTSQESKDIRLT